MELIGASIVCEVSETYFNFNEVTKHNFGELFGSYPVITRAFAIVRRAQQVEIYKFDRFV